MTRPSRTSTAPTIGLGLARPSPLAANSKARARKSPSRACAMADSAPPAADFISAVSRDIARSVKKRVDEDLRIEGHEIVGGLAGADEAHRQAQFAHDGDDDAAARGAVQLGEHDAGDAGGVGEFA